MKAIKFPECNVILKAPTGQASHVYDIDVCQTTNGVRDVTVVAWQPDEEDKARIAAGEPIWLIHYGYRLFPHSLQTGSPFAAADPAQQQHEINLGILNEQVHRLFKSSDHYTLQNEKITNVTLKLNWDNSTHIEVETTGDQTTGVYVVKVWRKSTHKKV